MVAECDRYLKLGGGGAALSGRPARRGLGSNLYRLGVPEMVIQRILRHANVSTTATYYIKTAAEDVRNAMAKLEDQIEESSNMRAGLVSPVVQ